MHPGLPHHTAGTLPPNLGMALLRPPPELQLRIFEYVGAKFFQEDVYRLDVLKRWYGLTPEVLAGHVNFTGGSLSAFQMLMNNCAELYVTTVD